MLAGEARGQSAKAKPEEALVLESVRLDPLFPSTSDLPTFDKLKWRRLKGKLGTDTVHKESRVVSSGMYYISYLKLCDRLEEQKKVVESARDYIQRLPGEYEAELEGARSDLADAESYARQKAHNKSLQKKYLDRAEAAQKKIGGLVKDYPEMHASAKKMLEAAEEILAKIEKESPEDRLWDNLMHSSIFNVISGIRYMEDPDEWLKAIKGYDPLFKNANSADVGEYSILSPKKHFYDVSFKRGHYVVSLMVTRGQASEKDNEEVAVGIHEVGKAIALAFDRALSGDVPGIWIEKNPDTQQPYAGLVADGSNTLAISIFLPEADGGVKVGRTKLGVLEQKTGDAWETVKSGDIPLQVSGKATLRYEPPEYITDPTLLQRLTSIHPKNEPDIRYAEETLSFSYTTKEGKDEKVDMPIRIFRPPVVLVHGFTGGLGTWERLDGSLTERGWDTRRDEYYFGEQGIADQAVLLRSNIQNIKAHYRNKDVKIQKVDLVVHSMGGLISRYYISLSGKYEDDVRKLIMVATPNHGASLTEKYIGNASSLFAGFAHSKAADELHEKSAIINQLNRNEAIGGHLNPGVQYAILYGRRHNYWIWNLWAADSYFPNDGVVSVDSALLNGVAAYLFDGTIHSGAIKAVYSKDDNICEEIPVFNKIQTLLLSDIPKVDLSYSDAVITKVSGDVQYWKYAWQLAKKGTSVQRNNVKTGPDSAAEIHFTQLGIPFASLHLKADTQVEIFNASFRYVRIYIYKGQARFVVMDKKKSSVEILAGKETSELKFYPVARIMHLDTDFEVSVRDGNVDVYSREGRVGVQYWDAENKPQGKLLTSGKGISLVGETNLMDMNNPPDGEPGDVQKADIQKPTALPASHTFPGTQANSVALTVSDTPPPVRQEGDNIYAPGAALYGRCTWQGPAPGTLLDVRVFRKTAPKAILTIPLLVPPGDNTLDFRIPSRPTGWDEGPYSVQVLSEKRVLAEASFEIKAR